MTLSVVIITFNEEDNLPRTLESVKWADEIIVVDSLSTDRTVEIARSYGAKVFIEPWKGFAAQKNSALEKATGDWILSLDADEEVSPELADRIRGVLANAPVGDKFRTRTADGESAPIPINGFFLDRKNMFMGRWIRHGGYWPDPKLRLFRRGTGKVKQVAVHEVLEVQEFHSGSWHIKSPRLRDGALLHHAYPTLSSYIEHMNRYSSLGAEMATAKRRHGFSFLNIVLRPLFTFIYNYFFRLGFLDGREGLLLHLYHSFYVSWKYAKAWELSRGK